MRHPHVLKVTYRCSVELIRPSSSLVSTGGAGDHLSTIWRVNRVDVMPLVASVTSPSEWTITPFLPSPTPYPSRLFTASHDWRTGALERPSEVRATTPFPCREAFPPP